MPDSDDDLDLTWNGDRTTPTGNEMGAAGVPRNRPEREGRGRGRGKMLASRRAAATAGKTVTNSDKSESEKEIVSSRADETVGVANKGGGVVKKQRGVANRARGGGKRGKGEEVGSTAAGAEERNQRFPGNGRKQSRVKRKTPVSQSAGDRKKNEIGEVCGGIGDGVKVCGGIGEGVKVCGGIGDGVKVCGGIGEGVKVCGGIGDGVKVCGRIGEGVKVCGGIGEGVKVCGGIGDGVKVCGGIGEGVKVCGGIGECVKMGLRESSEDKSDGLQSPTVSTLTSSPTIVHHTREQPQKQLELEEEHQEEEERGRKIADSGSARQQEEEKRGRKIADSGSARQQEEEERGRKIADSGSARQQRKEERQKKIAGSGPAINHSSGEEWQEGGSEDEAAPSRRNTGGSRTAHSKPMRQQRKEEVEKREREVTLSRSTRQQRDQKKEKRERETITADVSAKKVRTSSGYIRYNIYVRPHYDVTLFSFSDSPASSEDSTQGSEVIQEATPPAPPSPLSVTSSDVGPDSDITCGFERICQVYIRTNT